LGNNRLAENMILANKLSEMPLKELEIYQTLGGIESNSWQKFHKKSLTHVKLDL